MFSASDSAGSTPRPQRRLQRAVWPLVIVVPVMLGLVWACMEVLAASRAHVAALGYWSHAQKDAVVQLLRYAETHDPSHLAAYRRAIAVPQGDRTARQALAQDPPDRERARRGFEVGGNAPEDIGRLIWLFLNYKEAPFVADALRAWEATDAELDRLDALAAELETLVREGRATPEAVAALTAEIERVNRTLAPLQQHFARALSEGFDRMRTMLYGALCLTALALLAMGWLSARRMIERAVRAEQELALAERAVFAERDRALVTLQSIGDAVITADAQGRIDYLNPVAEKVTGWSNAEACGRPLEEVVRIVDEHGGNPVRELPERILRERGPIEIARNATLIRRDGSEVAIAESASRIRARSGEALGIVIVFRDVSRERRIAAQLSYHASHDLLTGLVNRMEFERRLQNALHSIDTERRSHVLLFIDLDRFKHVNDACGHAAGDQLLRQVSDLFAAELRESDTLARLGGDEFGILLENCSVEDALRIAEELRRRVENYRFVYEARCFSIGASIGLVPLALCQQTVSAALAAADRACYIAKEKGRNRIEMYVPDADEAHRRHIDHGWGERVARALEQDRLLLYAQPLMPLAADGEDAPLVEVYVRLRENGGQLVSPSAFMPTAERLGLMPQLDRWVIAKVLERAAHCLEAGQVPPCCIINLSAASIADKSLLDFVVEQFERHGVPQARFCFELTESELMTHYTQAQRFMAGVKALGCRVSLNEFGRTTASFGYARNLPLDFIKIDGMFVRQMTADPVDAATVEAINRIAHVLGKRTIAERVEDEAAIATLRAIGVDYAQGYAVAPVVPLEGFFADRGRAACAALSRAERRQTARRRAATSTTSHRAREAAGSCHGKKR